MIAKNHHRILANTVRGKKTPTNPYLTANSYHYQGSQIWLDNGSQKPMKRCGIWSEGQKITDIKREKGGTVEFKS